MFLLTSNPRKYRPLEHVLSRLGITLRTPDFDLPEIQDADPLKVLAAKARTAAKRFGQPCLVDDSGLLLDAYPGFPGTVDRQASARGLGGQGLARLLDGTTARAKLVCHLGLWLDGELRHWQGEVTGELILAVRPAKDRAAHAVVRSG